MLSKHVDELKIAGQKPHVGVFGKMKSDYNDFTNCGVHQHRSANGAVTLDQDEYIDVLIPINHVDPVKVKADQPAEGPLLDLCVALPGQLLARC